MLSHGYDDNDDRSVDSQYSTHLVEKVRNNTDLRVCVSLLAVRKKVVRYFLSSLSVILLSKRGFVFLFCFIYWICACLSIFICLSVYFLPFVAIDLYVWYFLKILTCYLDKANQQCLIYANLLQKTSYNFDKIIYELLCPENNKITY